MPFDKHLGASGARQLQLARAVAKQYVPVESRPPRFEVLDPVRQATLRAWVDTLIPAEDPWPAASERGIAEYIDNGAAGSGELRRMLTQAVDEIERVAGGGGEDFATADLDRRVEILAAYEAEGDNAADAAILLELTFEGYYRDRIVAHLVERQTGFRVAGPLAGIPTEAFDESWVGEVRGRPPHYLEVDA
jgi:gluconate 2-dehydrogenase subunit 3-like protein